MNFVRKKVCYFNKAKENPKNVRFYLLQNITPKINYKPPSLYAISLFYDTEVLINNDDTGINKDIIINYKSYTTNSSSIMYTLHISIYDKFNKSYNLQTIQAEYVKNASGVAIPYLNMWRS